MMNISVGHIDNFSIHLKSIPDDEWKRLFKLIPEVEKPKQFGELMTNVKKKDGLPSLPFWLPGEQVMEFINIVYDMKLAPPIDWKIWEEGKSLLNENEDEISNLDSVMLCKLITTILRTDRFCDGYLISKFKDGTIAKILKALKVQFEKEAM